MRILIYGAGAIGGYLGALLADGGMDVTLVARGAQYQALSSQGLAVQWEGGRSLRLTVPTVKPGEVRGRYDLVFVTLKATQLAAAATEISASLTAQGSLVMIQNGLPWWYFERGNSPQPDAPLSSLDPERALSRSFDLDRVVGAVIYKPVMTKAPGQLFVPNAADNELIIGEIDDRDSERCREIAAVMSAAGLPTQVTLDIRRQKWRKLMINLVWSPLCALTQSPSGAIAASPAGAELARTMMLEGLAVARSVGVELQFDPAAELRRVAGNFTQQPSMLQDVRAGRPLEWEAILQSVIGIAASTGVAVPTLKNIGACISLLDSRIRADGVAIAPIPVAQRSSA
jgi:2-dehydropantoate 2-reductase